MPYVVGIGIFLWIVYKILFSWNPLLYIYGQVNLMGEPDYLDAEGWFAKAANDGHAASQEELGELYENGFGVSKDYNTAAQLFQLSSDQGVASAKVHLGYLYKDGLGVQKDPLHAMDLFNEVVAGKETQSIVDKVLSYASLSSRFSDDPYKTAENGLGELYRYGNGVSTIYPEAISWFKKAADQDDAVGENNLAEMYRYGIGTEQDYDEAIDLFEDAADQDYVPAQTNIGEMYLYGYGTSKDYKEAFEWFEKAAAEGNARAQYHLGEMNRDGLGIPKSKLKAKEWFEKAALQGDKESQYSFSTLLMNDKDFEQSLMWAEKAAIQAHPLAQYRMGNFYQYGRGTQSNISTALSWYLKSAQNGYTPSYISAGKIYSDKHDFAKAFDCYLKAADKNLTEAYIEVGSMYYQGKGIAVDYANAVKWYQKAADKKDRNIQNRMGKMYLDGKGIGRDYVKAMSLFKEAASQQHPYAMVNIGIMYHDGIGITQDYHQAELWFSQAKKTLGTTNKEKYNQLVESIEIIHKSRWKNIIPNNIPFKGTTSLDVISNAVKYTGNLEKGMFSGSKQNEQLEMEKSCINTKPKVQERVSKELVITDHIRGLFNVAWIGKPNGHLMVVDKMRVFSDGTLPLENPKIKIYANYYNGQVSQKPTKELATVVNVYKGEHALLYRMFVTNNDAMRCADLVIPYRGEMKTISGKLYYIEDEKVNVTDVSLKALLQ